MAPAFISSGRSRWQRSPARVQADPDLLAAAWINLLDNAVRHGARQVDVEVTPTPDGGSCILVEDDGDGADPGRLQALRQALATQQYEGTTGLGLMLADLVARAHGGVVSLPAPARGRPGGFRVELRLGPSPEERST